MSDEAQGESRPVKAVTVTEVQEAPLVLSDSGGLQINYTSPGGQSAVRWGRFVRRLLMVLVRPGAFWERTRSAEVSVSELMWPHVILLVGLRALAGFVGQLWRGAGFWASFANFASSFVSWFALVWVFAVVVGSIATARGGKLAAQDPVRFAAFGLTPLFAVGMLAAIPLPYVAPIAELIAMPYTFHVLGLGAVPMLGLPVQKAPSFVGLTCGLLLILWGIMPTLVPLVVGVLTR